MARTMIGNPAKAYSASEGEKFNTDTTLVAVNCATCGVLYAIPESFRESALAYKGDTADGWKICCPFGHQWWYVGETELQKAQRLARSANDRAARATARADQAAASARAHKGHNTRLRKRAAAGVCPCCNRTFQQLAKHMKSQHPDFVEKHDA